MISGDAVARRLAVAMATLGLVVGALGVVTVLVGLSVRAGWALIAVGVAAAMSGGYLGLTGLGAVRRDRARRQARLEAQLDASLLAAAADSPAAGCSAPTPSPGGDRCAGATVGDALTCATCTGICALAAHGSSAAQ